MIRTSLMMFAALAATALGAGMFADTADARKFNASRARVLAACDQYGGGAFSDANAYGCAGDNGWIYCTANGSCEGGRTARRTSRKNNRALPPARRTR